MYKVEDAYGRYVDEAYANDGYVDVADAMVRYVFAAVVVERNPVDEAAKRYVLDAYAYDGYAATVA